MRTDIKEAIIAAIKDSSVRQFIKEVIVDALNEHDMQISEYRQTQPIKAKVNNDKKPTKSS